MGGDTRELASVGLGGAGGMQSAYNFTRRTDGWPPRDDQMNGGFRIAQAESSPGVVRNDLLVDKRWVGSLIGAKGSTYQHLQKSTNCRVFIIDKMPPPGESPESRLVSLIGQPAQVALATQEVLRIVGEASEMSQRASYGQDGYRKRQTPDGGFGGAGLPAGMSYGQGYQ